jgi:hypothetical protein
MKIRTSLAFFAMILIFTLGAMDQSFSQKLKILAQNWMTLSLGDSGYTLLNAGTYFFN